MNRVHVVVIPSENEGPHSIPRKFVGWIPCDYAAGLLKQDVARYWQLKADKYELYGPTNSVLDEDKPLEFTDFHPAILKLQRRERAPLAKKPSPDTKTIDPFWIHDQLFELFVFNALQNRQTNTLRITGFQFKHILQKATKDTVFQQKRKLVFDKRVTLAFRGAQTNSSGTVVSLGATFDEFLDALVDVACFMLPKESSKELALGKLATHHVIPYHEKKQRAGGPNTFSWDQMDDVLSRDKVQIISQRFGKSVGDLATSYSANVGIANDRCVLRYHEFHRFVRDVVPTTVRLGSAEVCKVFMYCARKEHKASNSFVDQGNGGPECSSADEEALASNILSGLGTSKLEITCGKMIDVIGYIALLTLPRLVKAKEKMPINIVDVGLTSKLGVQCLKALLHHISNFLGAKGGACLKKNAEFNRARIHFLVAFNKMHREDELTDYESGCVGLLRAQKCEEYIAPSTNQEVDPAKQEDTDLDAEFSWNLDTQDAESSSESEASNSPTSRTSIRINPQVLLEQKRRELEQSNTLANEGDEIYSFLAGELQRHAISKRSDGPDTVPHMLDVWVSAGEKYSEVINHVEPTSLLHAKFLSRFGRSLYVFASQVLKRTTKVYRYEELFYMTNARVYTTTSDLWQDNATLFTLDLAMETLSLASGKLAQASEEFNALVTSSKETDRQSDSEGDSSDEDDDVLTPSALYDRYLSCLYFRANCLAAYGDVTAHGKKAGIDYDLGCCFTDDSHVDERSTTSDTFFASPVVLSKTSSPGQFYWEAKKMFRFLLQHSKGGLNFSRSRLHHNLAMVQFKLATHLPRGCEAEKKLLENALQNLEACEQLPDPIEERNILESKRNYIRAILAARRKFFITENLTPALSEEARDVLGPEDNLAPFYRFVLAAEFSEFDPDKKGVILLPELTLMSKACGHRAVSAETFQWLLDNFDNLDGGLTERGVLQYFCWLAEADPVAFCNIIDLLTAKHTGAHNISIYSGDSVFPRKHSALKASSPTRKTSISTGSERLRAKRTGVADCVVVLSGKLSKTASIDISRTTSPSDIRLEPEVVDVLPSRASLPEELSKFCFPDDIYLTKTPFSPKTFDIVLTDIKGSRSYGTCLQFCEEKHPMDVLGLISATEKGRTADLPSWVSLKDIQQGQTKWKCYTPKCLCVLSSSPLFQTFRDFLVYLYRVSLASASSSLPLEAIIFNFLEQTPLPTANSTQTIFKLGDTTRLLSGFPSNLPLFSPTEVDFTILFQCLNPDNILKVYGYLLTEKKVVLSSSSRPILTHVAETLRALLHPFECQHVYIPLLPLSLVEFICAPVPFFMGIRSDQRLERLMAEGVILVDLDNNDIRLPPNEELPVLADVKARKLLHTLRKLSIWPASQRSRHTVGRGFNDDERPIPATFIPSQPSEAEATRIMQHHDDLTEKWNEIHSLFSSFATKLLKEVRKHCTRAPSSPASSNSSNNNVIFDERSFLAMHPSLREFCTHLFQTQLFQRSIENIWAFSDTSSTTEPEQYWKAVRAKSLLRKNSETVEDVVKPQRRVIHAPLPPRKQVQQKLASQGTADGFPIFNGQLYDDLLEEFGDLGDLESSACEYAAPVRPLLPSETSSTSILTSPSFYDDDADAFQLVNAARKRLEGRRGGEIAE